VKRIIFTYGTICGLLMALTVIGIAIFIDKIGFERGSTVSSIGMIVSYLMVYLGIYRSRETIGGGYIGFRQAFLTGLFIVAVAALFYAGAELLQYYVIAPDILDKSDAFNLAQAKAAKVTQDELNKIIEAQKKMREIVQSPFLNFAVSYTGALPFGVFFTLTSSLILRKKDFGPRPTAEEIKPEQ